MVESSDVAGDYQDYVPRMTEDRFEVREPSILINRIEYHSV